MAHSHSHKVTPAPKALISKCQLVNRETSEKKVAQYRDAIFTLQEKKWVETGHPEGSPWQVWYRNMSKTTPPPSATADPNSLSGLVVHDYHDPRTRNIVIKEKAEFIPDNIFFRTVDTGRLLPMELADFRIEWYAHKDHWEHVDRSMKKKGNNGATWEMYLIGLMVRPFLPFYRLLEQFIAYKCG